MTLSIPDPDPEADVLTAALAYAAAGWYVLPVNRKTKHPGSVVGKDWPSKSSRDAAQIAAWFAGSSDGLALHCGRSGAVAFDADKPELMPLVLLEEIDREKPPFQASRAGNDFRGHYVFRQPQGRMIGNGTGALGGAWGEVRGRNGIIMAWPTPHSKAADGGEYQWLHTGPVPVLGPTVADILPDQITSEDAASDADIGTFLGEHRASARPELIDGVIARFKAALEAGEGRHPSAVTAVCWAAREAQAGLYDMRAALAALWPTFRDALRNESNRRPAAEWKGIVAWAIGQAPLDDPAATFARLTAAEPFGSTEDGNELFDAFPRLNWHTLWEDDEEEDWIVEPLIPARRLIALYSAPKIGKSLLMLELAVAVAVGKSVLGCRTPNAPRRVLYVDFENDPKGDVRTRLTSMGYGPDDLDNLVYLSFPSLAALDSAAGGAQLVAVVAAYGCEVVVIDTVSRAIKGEENENDTWLNFYRHTGKALKAGGIALVRLDHTGKDETKGQRGGSAKSGDVDAVWRMSVVKKDEVYQLDCEANRMPVSERSLVLHREKLPHLHHRVDAAGRASSFEIRVREVMDALDAAGVDRNAGRPTVKEALKSTGVRASTNALEEAIKRRKGINVD
jgi:hypothetical protein